jgi:hypothetical protein
MAIIAKEKGGNYTPAPAGVHQAVCVDVVELGLIQTTYGGKTTEKEMIRLIWQIEEINESTGLRFTVQRRYSLSLHAKASLRKDLESWRAKPFTAEELKGFDVERLIGANCFLNVVHETRENSTYANIAAIMPLKKGTPKMEPDGYIQVKDRIESQETERAEDDEVPF